MEIDKIARIYRGRTYKVGDIIYPDCGHHPPDYIIEGFKQGKKYTHMWGYHPASDKELEKSLWVVVSLLCCIHVTLPPFFLTPCLSPVGIYAHPLLIQQFRRYARMLKPSGNIKI